MAPVNFEKVDKWEILQYFSERLHLATLCFIISTQIETKKGFITLRITGIKNSYICVKYIGR